MTSDAVSIHCRETLDLLAFKENKVQRENSDHVVSLENLVNRDHQVLKEIRDLPAHLDQLDCPVHLDHPDLLVPKDLLD